MLKMGEYGRDNHYRLHVPRIRLQFLTRLFLKYSVSSRIKSTFLTYVVILNITLRYITFDLIVIQSQRVIWNFQNLISHISLLINDLKNPFRITKSNIRSDKFFQETDFDFKIHFGTPLTHRFFNSILRPNMTTILLHLVTFGFHGAQLLNSYMYESHYCQDDVNCGFKLRKIILIWYQCMTKK